MVITKSEEVTKQGFSPICKILWRKLRLRKGLLLCLIWVCVGGSGVGWALIRGWALINFFCLWDGRLFEVGANSRLGAYSNKYGIQILKRQQCTVSRKTNPNASGEIAQNKYKINSRPTRLFFSLKKPDFLWSLTTIWFPQGRSFTSLTALSFVCFR